MREALAGVLGTWMRGDERIVTGVQTNLLSAATNPQGLTNQAERRRVECLLKHHVAVTMQLDALPERQVIGRSGKRLKQRLLAALKAQEWLLVGGAVVT